MCMWKKKKSLKYYSNSATGKKGSMIHYAWEIEESHTDEIIFELGS